ncbi:hypothetical protein GGX14DRAFT_331781, partial [Mycena pura]
GSFQYDLASSTFPKQWKDWLQQEQRQHCIELRLVKTTKGTSDYERKCRFVCSRAGTGGVKQYTRQCPERQQKMASKRTDCLCFLLVKQYPGISTIMGKYCEDHDHTIGNANLRFTRISKDTREHIAGILRLKVL